MKLLKRKNFQSFIYLLMILLPLSSLLPNIFYFAFNEKASDYTHVEINETYEYETNEVNNIDDLIEGNIYHISLQNYYVDTAWNLNIINAYNINLSQNTTISVYNNNVGEIFVYSNARFYCSYSKVNDLYIGFATNTNPTIDFSCDFTYRNGGRYLDNIIQYISASDYLGEKTVEVVQDDMNPSNAFEYSISKFLVDNNFGRIDFFGFFASLFLTSTQINSLYIGFINWYLNYILYVSLAYLLFSVLLWFVNFGRRLLEDSENINIGGF